MASGDSSATTDTTRDFLRSFSVVDVESEESDYDELTPIPEVPGEPTEDINEVDGMYIIEENHSSKIIPYKSVFAPAVPFSSLRENCWIPGLPIIVNISAHERQAALKMLNPNLYRIDVSHGERRWTIYRRYKHFRQLHDSLALFRARYKLPLPSREHHQRRATIKKDLKGMKQRQQKAVRFPLRPEALISEENIPQRKQQLQEYLQNLLTCKSYRNHPETLKFFEVSHLSFVNKTGEKFKEGLIEKCSGGRRINIQCCGCLQNLHFAGSWNKRWLVVKDSYILYIRPEDGHISDVLLMDSAFSVKSGLSNTGATHGCLIENLSRKLLIKCWTSRKAKEWAEQINFVAESQAVDYTHKNRFSSFAPPREDSYARWFVDGKTYFEAVADALEKAKEEIYITDWWLSPEIYLKRPIVDGDNWRLDIVLKRKAEQGVKVFILLYKEIEAALNIKSIYSKQTLMSHCPENIKVLRHPDHIPGKGVLLWAHHEKLVIIDQQIAFAGGLDLCYGRWDDEFHKMTDLGSISLKPRNTLHPSTSDSNIPPEYSSHTEISTVTDDNPNEMDTGAGAGVTFYGGSSSEGLRKSAVEQSSKITADERRHSAHSSSSERFPKSNITFSNTADSSSSLQKLSDSKTSSGSGSLSSSKAKQKDTSQHIKQQQWQQSSSSHSSPSHPIDANVLVTVTSPSIDHDDNNDDDDEDFEREASDYHGYTAGAGIPTNHNSPFNNHVQSYSDTLIAPLPSTTSRKKRRKELPRQPSNLVDTEGFSETVLGEINRSMTPFKDIHNESYFQAPHEEVSLQEVCFENINHGFNNTLDTEIITSIYADNNYHRGSAGSSPSNSPVGKRKDSVADKIKSSHLWNRRSKKKTLELIIPNKNGIQNASENVGEDAETQPSVDKKPSKKAKKVLRQSLIFKRNKYKLDAPESERRSYVGSESSGTSRASDSELTSDTAGLQSVPPVEARSARDSSSPPTDGSHTPFSFSGAASAVNAFRRMIHHKEQNNNLEDGNASPTSKEESANAARRRWKMVLNVTKFETMVRTPPPQVPEIFDESLFYNQNIQHPKMRHRLVKSFKEGVDKLTRHGSRRDSIELKLKVDKSTLGPPMGMYHTDSEEDILERGLLGSTKLWIGKDYVNFIFKDFVSLELPFEDFIDRTKYPRMPWHDIGCVLYGKSARDLARHFIGRWNFTKLKKCKRNPNFPLLIPKTLANSSVPRIIKGITFEVKAQVLRSCGGWSAGIWEPEYSIHEAYEHCIENARNFIYIENQFFITQMGNNQGVHNGIGRALYKRILRAHRSSSNFKVYVVMPLLPAFEGEFGTNTGAALQAVTHWNYSSICRGGLSLMEKLAQEIPDPNKYIVFCGLRSWGRLDGKLFTELIYVHSKLMIVDDDTVIIGSANINDRSMLGARDSEIAVMFEDIHKVNVTVNGKQYQAGKFASSLRWTIFREHLGIHNDPDFVDLTDIASDAFYKEVWVKRAAINTTCFDKVFRCLPTDNVKNFSQLREYQSIPQLAVTNEGDAMTWLNKVKGYLVLMPLQFLKEENLTPKVGQKEALLPTYLWT